MNRKYNDVKWHKVDNTLQCHDNALNVTNQTHGRAAKKKQQQQPANQQEVSTIDTSMVQVQRHKIEEYETDKQ